MRHSSLPDSGASCSRISCSPPGVCPISCVNGRAVIGLEVVCDACTVVNGERVEDVFPAGSAADEVLAVLPPFGTGQIQNLHCGVDSTGQCNTSD